jgi:sugar O-acyltransferase (sialic acid O-acetyltransferase NeuD family)
VLHLIGAGGHASVVADVARRAGVTRITLWSDGDVDLSRFPSGTAHMPLDRLEQNVAVVLAVGDLATRRELRDRFRCIAPAVADPSAILSERTLVGHGTVVMPNCVVNANTRIGEDAILNTGCIVEHDCEIGVNAHLSPGVRLAGAVRVGAQVHVGIGAIVLPGIAIGEGAVVGAGAVVHRDVSPGTTVAGVPARPLRS